MLSAERTRARQGASARGAEAASDFAPRLLAPGRDGGRLAQRGARVRRCVRLQAGRAAAVQLEGARGASHRVASLPAPARRRSEALSSILVRLRAAAARAPRHRRARTTRLAPAACVPLRRGRAACSRADVGPSPKSEKHGGRAFFERVALQLSRREWRAQATVAIYFTSLVLLKRLVAWRGKPLDAELRGYVLGARALPAAADDDDDTRASAPEATRRRRSLGRSAGARRMRAFMHRSRGAAADAALRLAAAARAPPSRRFRPPLLHAAQCTTLRSRRSPPFCWPPSCTSCRTMWRSTCAAARCRLRGSCFAIRRRTKFAPAACCSGTT